MSFLSYTCLLCVDELGSFNLLTSVTEKISDDEVFSNELLLFPRFCIQ